MSNVIQPAAIGRIQYAPPVSNSPAVGAAEGASQATFKEMLLDSIRQANILRQDADQAVASLGSQRGAAAADVFGAVEQTDLAFRTMIEVHNKLVQAYQEVQNMVD